MQEFLKNNTVNCNFMSLTGYRTLVLLQALMDSPKSIDEINECFLNNQYIKETFSSDTLRIYINSLRAIGCDITKANKATNNKYVLKSHPFYLDVPKKQLIAISKVYKNMYDKLTVDEVLSIENFFKKICKIISDKDAVNYIENLSAFKDINISALEDLIIFTKKKTQINFLYNSPNSGVKEVSLVADKLSFKSEKLYLWGYSSLHNEYSYFRVDRIVKLLTVNIRKDDYEIPVHKVVFKIITNGEFSPAEDEKIISKNKNTYTVEKVSKSKFSLMQDLLNKGENCIIVSPESIKKLMVEKLQQMEDLYRD